jgi:hypothetical protein
VPPSAVLRILAGSPCSRCAALRSGACAEPLHALPEALLAMRPAGGRRRAGLKDRRGTSNVLPSSCGDASALLVSQFGLPKDLLRGAAAGPSAGVGALGVAVPEVAFQVEP